MLVLYQTPWKQKQAVLRPSSCLTNIQTQMVSFDSSYFELIVYLEGLLTITLQVSGGECCINVVGGPR